MRHFKEEILLNAQTGDLHVASNQVFSHTFSLHVPLFFGVIFGALGRHS